MKIGLFFGSFNPIHTGHLIIAEHIINSYTNEVWFVISPQNPLKKKEDLLDINNRLLLTRAAIKENKSFRISDVELNLPTPSYTIDTLQHLSRKYPRHEFFVVMGSDNFLNIASWKSADAIIAGYKIIVYERSGFLVNAKNLNPNIICTKAPFIDVSSSEIRKLIAAKKSIRYLVPEEVNSLIQKNMYY